MALTDKEVESQLTQRRLDVQALTLKCAQLINQVSQLQDQINTSQTQLNNVAGTLGQLGNNSLDTYPDAGGILHRLKTRFLSIVTFSASFILQGLTMSRPLKIDSTGTAVADKIDLAAPTTDIKNTLGLANGGTNGTTAATARAGISAAALPQTINGSSFISPNISQTCTGSQSVTVTGSSFTAPIGGGACSGSFSFTINGSNFTVAVTGSANSGSQALV